MKIALSLFILACASAVFAGGFHLTKESPIGHDNGALLEGAWRYHPGDDPRFSQVEFDDSNWTVVKEPWVLPPDWKGNGWFRIHVSADENFVQVPLSLFTRIAGSMDLFVQGRRAISYPTSHFMELNPQTLVLPSRDTVIAARISCPNPEQLSRLGFFAGPVLWIGDWNVQPVRIRQAMQQYQLLIGLMTAFAVLHGLLFLFHRDERVNLYFSVFALAFAIMVFAERQDLMVHREGVVWIRRLWGFGMILLPLAALRFTYSLGGVQKPRYFPVLVLIGIGTMIWGWNRLSDGWIDPAGAGNYLSLFALILLAEMGRSFAVSAIRRVSGSIRILGWGSLPLIITGIYQMFINFGLAKPIMPIFDMVPLPYYTMLILLIAMSVHLSRSFAETNLELRRQLQQVKALSEEKLEQERRAQQQETQRKLLEADHRRKTEELEEARHLQLSMLPEKVPQIPGLDAVFYMKTATEVGGDYYDFYRNSDGVLTIAIGDATGHGMQAGTMVAAAKSLFQNLAEKPELAAILKEMSVVLKRMNFGKMYMALALARFHGSRIQLACGGMPPPLIYRASSKNVEVVRPKGIWLGGTSFPFEQIETELASGDTLLMMSDGYPETFNPLGEMLGYEQARLRFAEAAQSKASDVIAALVQHAEEWSAGRSQQDDITFALVRAQSATKTEPFIYNSDSYAGLS